MRKLTLIICLMTAIAASAQKESDIVEVEWTDRYAVASKDGKCGIIDMKADSLVTELIFDEAFPAYRKRVFGEYVTYYSVRQGDRLGIVGIFEETNTPTIILAPPTASQDASENWEDSVRVYREQIRNGDAEAYLKLATCYHEGKGVKHNFPLAFWLTMQAAESVGEERASQLFLNMPEDDTDRVKFDAAQAFFTGNKQKLKEVGQRLAQIDAGSGELVEGLLSMINKKNEEATMHFSKAVELGCKLAALFRGAIQQPYSEDNHINTLLELAEGYPFVYCNLGDMMARAADPAKQAKAIEYYKLADEYACLNKEGRAFLNRQ